MNFSRRLRRARPREGTHIFRPHLKSKLLEFISRRRVTIMVTPEGGEPESRTFTQAHELELVLAAITRATDVYLFLKQSPDGRTPGYLIGNVIDRFQVGGFDVFSVSDCESDREIAPGNIRFTMDSGGELEVDSVAIFTDFLDFTVPMELSKLIGIGPEEYVNLVFFQSAVQHVAYAKMIGLGVDPTEADNAKRLFPLLSPFPNASFMLLLNDVPSLEEDAGITKYQIPLVPPILLAPVLESYVRATLDAFGYPKLDSILSPAELTEIKANIF